MLPDMVIETSKALARAATAHLPERERDLASLEYHLNYLRGWKHGHDYAMAALDEIKEGA